MQELTRRDCLDELDEFEGKLKNLGLVKGEEEGNGDEFS